MLKVRKESGGCSQLTFFLLPAGNLHLVGWIFQAKQRRIELDRARKKSGIEAEMTKLKYHSGSLQNKLLVQRKLQLRLEPAVQPAVKPDVFSQLSGIFCSEVCIELSSQLCSWSGKEDGVISVS